MRAALFVGCLNDTFFPEAGRATVAVLERLGVTVEFPLEQTCCGQMHLNSGFDGEGAALARRFARVFADHEVIVTPAASCAAAIKELAHHEPELAGVSSRVRELATFVHDDLGVREVGARLHRRVALHPTCHSLRMLAVGDAPAALLRHVEGLELVELERPRECCGFGGTFAVKNASVSSAMLADKLLDIRSADVDVLCAVDTSCLMHLGGGLRRQQAPVRTMHLAEVLATREPA